MTGDFPQMTTSNYVMNAYSGANFGIGQIGAMSAPLPYPTEKIITQPEKEKCWMKRLVQVAIADPDENVTPEDSLLYYDKEPKLTDLTDQEMYFEIPVNDLLKTHNEKRKTVVDKKASEKFGKEIFLQPLKIRDLKMVVVEIAKF